MSQIDQAWGSVPSANYERLHARFQPIFDRIAVGAVEREVKRILPVDAIRELKDAGFGAVRVPTSAGGGGASLPDLFRLLIALAEADSNIPQALRGHFGLAEDIVTTKDRVKKERWYPRLLAGETAGNAWTEIGEAARDTFATRVSHKDGKFVLNGKKYYTTGSLFADWIDVGATGTDGEGVSLAIRRHQPGIEIHDDWDGFGQRLTASGTTIFTDAVVEPEDIVKDTEKFGYATGLYQLFHLATLAGIGRAIVRDVSAQVSTRRRNFSHAANPEVARDPQVLAVIGRIRSAAYAAQSLTIIAAEALQRAHEAALGSDEEAIRQANVAAELETAQAQTVIIPLILEAAGLLFDTLGASAAKSTHALDRHWRNARTLASHNPVIFKHRIIGDFAVNGTEPPAQWRIGQSPAAA